MKKNSQKDEKTKTKGVIDVASNIIYGRILSADFFAHNWVYVLLGVAMILIYITNKYQCLTKMEEIRALEQKLEIVETERVRVRGEYMSRVRESSMAHLVDSLRLNLKVQEQPPFKLSYDEKQ